MRYLLACLLFLCGTPVFAQDTEEQACLIEALYFEARSEKSIHGKIAVATVIFNRVKSSKFPNTICGVVRQAERRGSRIVLHRCQFSYYCDGKREVFRDPIALQQVKAIAELLSHDVRINNFECVLFYHAEYVMPDWARSMERVGQIESHIFYRAKSFCSKNS